MSKKTATLDLTGCQYIGELHQRIKEALDFPEHYGCNWDAFWDSISCDCDVDIVTIVGSDKVADELKSSVKKMLEILERNRQFWADSDYPFEYIVAD